MMDTPGPDHSDNNRLAQPADEVVAKPIPISEATLAIPMAPIREQDRIVSMDALRGFALFGILIVNINFFANGMPAESGQLWNSGNVVDDIAFFLSRFFGNYKFVTLFSLLFGMGLAIQNELAIQRNRPFVPLYLRRVAVLLGFGIVHGVVFWYGDILTLYAILGAFALMFRNASRRTLLTLAAILMLVPLITIPALFALEQWANEANEANVALQTGSPESETSDVVETQPAGGEMIEAEFDLERILTDGAAVEFELYGKGPLHLAILHRGVHYVAINIAIGIAVLIWRCLAMFLIGIVIIRSGMMRRLTEHRRFLRLLTFVAMPAGFAIQAVGEYIGWKYERGYWTLLAPEMATYIGSFFITMGYFGAICLISLSNHGPRVLSPFVAAGRIALTNYIGQSVLCGLIFYSFGLGLIGQIRFSVVLLIALGIYATQVLFSLAWLRFFRFGPLEWVWRSLTYMRLQPIRKRPAPLVQE